MRHTFHTEPAHAITPGVTVLRDGAIFGVVFCDGARHGVILYHLPDGEETRIELTDEHRFGSLYSVRVSGLRTGEWGYRYYSGDRTFEDPYARGFVSIGDGSGKLRVCRFYHAPEDILPVYSPKELPAWQDQFLYCLHVRGFTMDPAAGVRHPGTFSGVTEKIPYLQSLGVTGVELMPVYEPRLPEQPVGRSYEVDRFGRPRRREDEDPYWWYGEGYYFALRESYGSEDPQKEFAEMVEALHGAGIRVFLQMSFPGTVSAHTQCDALRFYVTHYGIDGFRLLGSVTALHAIVSDPLLSDTAILYREFPYGEIRRINADNPWSGAPRTGNLAEYRNDFSRLVRRFVKSDDYCMPAFAEAFTDVETGHGNIRYICGSDGFTLRDLVSYNEKHNERNGEDNRDGENENFSWNCGEEGESKDPEVLRLRRRQARNFLTILFLSQGTPLLSMGDERWNTRRGNNNPYCCDDADGWMNWGPEDGAEEVLQFVKALSAFRSAHPVLRRRAAFKGTDDRSCGYPDLSLHGAEAWRPEIGNFAHTLGWLLREDLPEEADCREQAPQLLYIGINTYWEPRRLALPRPPKGTAWDIVINTDDERGFLPGINTLRDSTEILLAPRSIVVLKLTPVRTHTAGRRHLWDDHAPFLNGRKTHIDMRQLSPRIKERLYRLR